MENANFGFQSPFIEAGAIAYMDWLRFLWSKTYNNSKLKAVFVGNVEDMRKAKDVVKNIEYPMVLVAFGRMELDMATGAGAARFRKFTSAIDRNRGVASISTATPVRIGFAVRFKSEKATDCMAYAEMMLQHFPGYAFYFEDDTGFRAACRLYIEEGYDIPQNDIGGPGDIYTMESVFSLRTYITTRERQGLIRQIKIDYEGGLGGITTTAHIDKLTGNVQKLDGTTLDYTGPFDRNSSQWKGV